jgi:hypothetical protein
MPAIFAALMPAQIVKSSVQNAESRVASLVRLRTKKAASDFATRRALELRPPRKSSRKASVIKNG